MDGPASVRDVLRNTAARERPDRCKAARRPRAAFPQNQRRTCFKENALRGGGTHPYSCSGMERGEQWFSSSALPLSDGGEAELDV